MLRVIFAVVMILHGLIHLLGFVREWGLAQVPQLTGNTVVPLSEPAARLMGVLWLVACAAFAVAAVAYLARVEWWWIVAAAVLLLSQALIIVYWRDAWAGTIANLVILPVVVVSGADVRFRALAQRDVEGIRTLAAASPSSPARVSRSSLDGLPVPVVGWLERAGVVGREPIRQLRLRQRGKMCTKPGGSWVSFEAEQHFSIDPPAFVWTVRVNAAPLVHLAGKDRYVDGRGHMLIKALSLVPVADSRGPEIDQGALVRYMAEIVWFPTAALERYIRWDPIDESSARSTMVYGGVTGEGIWTFDAQSDMTNFEALRYGEFDGQSRLERWHVATKGYATFGGIRVPNRSEATWRLETGDYTWLRLEITEVQYDGVGIVHDP